MSYGLEYGYDVAARARPSERAMFIRNTYAHLAGAVLGSAVGGLAIGLGSYEYNNLAWLTLCGGIGAAALALPLATRRR